ncbi:uncharacterized protein LOC124155868 [Ischnura elegans]|uniref:uncharacterized protein LOC124155868 n=1 Tax=Ischnura elegans TaxID=197161 RepID=UPI001ED87731|nr:uncharacterized protein LOC124155868 [Ischnura elegans]
METKCSSVEEIDKILPRFVRLKDEYDGIVARNLQKLSLLGLSISSLPKDIRESLEISAKFAQILGLEYLNKNSLMIRNSELLLAEHEVHEKQFEKKLNAIKVKKVLKDLEELTALIKRMCERSLDDFEAFLENEREKSSSVAFLEEKMKHYSQTLKTLDETICEADPKVNLKEVMECHENIKSMDEEIRTLKLKLDRYKDLPPNVILAKEKLTEEKLALQKLEEEVESAIEDHVRRLQ